MSTIVGGVVVVVGVVVSIAHGGDGDGDGDVMEEKKRHTKVKGNALSPTTTEKFFSLLQVNFPLPCIYSCKSCSFLG